MDAWCIEVAVRADLLDASATATAEALAGHGVAASGVLAIRGYLLPASLRRDEVERAARELLADPIADRFVVAAPGLAAPAARQLWPEHATSHRLVVRRLPGVMDPVARTVREALQALGIAAQAAGTYRAFLVRTSAGEAVLRQAAAALANDVIEEVLIDRLPPGLPLPGGKSKETRVEIALASRSEAQLVALSRERCFSLNAAEMRAVQRHFEELGRAPTLTELETIAQTWSEHCKHKTLTGRVIYEDEAEPERSRAYDNLLKETIFAVTKAIDHPFCISVFADNAGVIDFDGKDCLCIKVETHNHPSAIEPFGGAGTGIGGVIRDILGTGLGAKPLCNVDVFCVAPPDLALDDVPPGALHPARVLAGIVAGVRDYGNPIGIPTVSGAVHFDRAFAGNPLVYCGTVGILPKKMVRKAAKPGDRVFLIGGRTGRDGIHGATFSSIELSEDSETTSSGAVQIGDPITEKRVLDALLAARDEGLYDAVTDCGAGGLSSAVGEMGEATGARVDLEHVPLKYSGLTPTEVWISEAQERMVCAVPEAKAKRFADVCARWECEATDIGAFTDTKRLEVRAQGEVLADLDMEFLHHGVPRPERQARYTPPRLVEPGLPPPESLGAEVLAALGDLEVASKEWILRQYDHEVQGASAAKPLAGPRQQGPGDAAIVAPKPPSPLGFALATGLNPRYSWLDPAAMAEAALDEAVRNVVARGGDPTRCALLDNYCWGSCDRPEQLGALVRATQAACELALAYRTPFVSGKDSLNNEYRSGDRTLAIPGCLLVTALAIVPDVREARDSAFVEAGSAVYLLGITRRELGGSIYWKRRGALGVRPPRARPGEHLPVYRFLYEAMANGVRSAHDLSEGGLAVAAAEMAFGGGVGLFLDLGGVLLDRHGNDEDRALRDDEVLFSESLGRILVEVDRAREAEFTRFLHGLRVPLAKVGETLKEPVLVADGVTGDRLFELPLADLEAAWRTPLAQGPLALAPKAAGGQA